MNYLGQQFRRGPNFNTRILLERIRNPNKSNLELARIVARNMLKEKYNRHRRSRNGLRWTTAANFLVKSGALRTQQFYARLHHEQMGRYMAELKMIMAEEVKLARNGMQAARMRQPRVAAIINRQLRQLRKYKLRIQKKLLYLRRMGVHNAAKFYTNKMINSSYKVGNLAEYLHSLGNRPRSYLATRGKKTIANLRALTEN